MKKSTINYVCQECGYDTPQWLGKCPECGAWNSFKEIHIAKGLEQRIDGFSSGTPVKAQKLSEIATQNRLRIQTSFAELNTVLGGGIVLGSVLLLAGDPGVGKSTLLLQLCLSLAQQGKKVLYISGEESVDQIKMRAIRLQEQQVTEDAELRTKNKLDRHSGERNDSRIERLQDSGHARMTDIVSSGDNLYLVSMTDSDAAVEQIQNEKPDLVIIDSIQTMQSNNAAGLSGAVGQVRYATLGFVRAAKTLNIPVILVGHVTKEGMVAGPMVLSHMVDCVLFLEGEKFTTTRILRSYKNRFGPVDEVGIFQMMESGMQEVTNPEQLFLSQEKQSTPGSVLVVTMEGSRPFLVELQALAVYSKLVMPRRVVSGVDQRRVELLLAVLQKHCRLPVETMDVFINVAGGLKIADPAVDLGICLAVYASIKNIDLSQFVGIAEIGLLGELRPVTGLEKRIREAKKLGFSNIITHQTDRRVAEVFNKLGRHGKL